MGLRDDIQTLETIFYGEQGNQDDGHELAKAIAEMIGRKGSKRLVWQWFDDLYNVLNNLGRYDELVEAAGNDPANMGVWDCQAAVATWLAKQE